MFVGICKISYHFPYTETIKEKRQKIASMKDILRKRFNISIAEIEFQNFWQKTVIGISIVNSNKKLIDKVLSKVIEKIENIGFGYITDYKVEFINIGEMY